MTLYFDVCLDPRITDMEADIDFGRYVPFAAESPVETLIMSAMEILEYTVAVGEHDQCL